MTPSQFRNYVRQQENKFRQEVRRAEREINREIDKVNRANKAAAEKFARDYNREADRVNRHNKQVLDNHNREVARVNRSNVAAVTKYNQAVRSHNARVESQRQQRLRQLRSNSTPAYSQVRTSSIQLNERYDELAAAGNRAAYDNLVALSETEAANSAEVAEALSTEEPAEPQQIEDSGLLEYLSGFSQDLCDRWRGALYALSPSNPDAARHFCTSAREIFTEILDKWAPNTEVVKADPDCEMTPNNSAPSRRAKIQHFLRKKGADTPQMLGFVDNDVEDVLKLFHVFNDATHGEAGKHGFHKLQTIRKRVEGSIMFLATVAL